MDRTEEIELMNNHLEQLIKLKQLAIDVIKRLVKF